MVRENWEYQLQPLRIPSGWLIDVNKFFEVDPSEETKDYFYGSYILSAFNSRSGIALELSYEPEGSPDGEYILSFYKMPKKKRASSKIDYGSIENIGTFRSKSRIEIVGKIESFMIEQPWR